MGINDLIASREGIDGLVTAFETFTSGLAELADAPIEKLPEWMRLTPYFLACTEPEYVLATVAAKSDGLYLGDAKEGETTIFHTANSKVAVCVDNTRLEHSVRKEITTEGEKCFYQEILSYGVGEDCNPQALLYAGNTGFTAGHDSNQINRVGAVIWIDKEGFLGKLLKKHDVGFDKDKYAVTASQHGIAITPNFDVSEENFSQTMADIIGITNRVLKVLETKYSKECEYLAVPGKK